jgi:hypothetical protein
MTERPRFLAMLAEEDRKSGAPPRVEEFLRSRVKEKQPTRGRWGFSPAAALQGLRNLTAWPAFAAGALAGIGLAAFLLRPSAPVGKLDAPGRFAPEVPSIAHVQPLPQTPAVETSPLVASAAPATIRSIPAARRVNRKPQPRPELVDQPQQLGPQRFYEIAYAPPELLATGQIVRVKVPRAALLSFGLPLNAYRPNAGKVDADVIFTEDGIARAIRFVP